MTFGSSLPLVVLFVGGLMSYYDVRLVFTSSFLVGGTHILL